MSTVLGAKKRAAKSALPPPIDDKLEFESSSTLDEPAAPAPTTEPKRPASPLEQFLKRMGVQKDLSELGHQLGFIEEEVEFVPPVVVETPTVDVKPEPVIEPEQDYQATVHKQSKPAWGSQKVEQFDLMSRLEHLPQLQQAILLKEILDRPRAARFGIR